jgi:hypothetical protein
MNRLNKFLIMRLQNEVRRAVINLTFLTSSTNVNMISINGIF